MVGAGLPELAVVKEPDTVAILPASLPSGRKAPDGFSVHVMTVFDGKGLVALSVIVVRSIETV